MLLLVACLAAVASAAGLMPVAEPVPHYVRMLADVPPIPVPGPGPRPGAVVFGVDSFPSPDTTPFGLEWINGNLWNSDLRAQRIYQLDPANGQVKRSFAAPDQWTKDLAFDGSYLYACGNYASRIYKIDTTTGGVISSYYAPGSNPCGLCFDGTYLWNADLNSDQSQPSRIYKLNPANGQVLASFVTPAAAPSGLAWDGQYLWNADMNGSIVYQLDPADGHVVGAVGTPGPKATGLAWDGHRLWNADWSAARIYSFAPDSGPAAIVINQPVPLDVLPCWRDVAIVGTVVGGEFQHYVAEYGLGDNPVAWTRIGGLHVTPVCLDTLASWDVSSITEPGIYTLRIKAVFTTYTDSLRRVTVGLDPDIMPGWPQTFVNASPVGTGDVTGDAEHELFAGLHHQHYLNQRLGGWERDGSALDGFPVMGINNNQMAPAIGDLGHTGEPYIVTGYDLNNDQVNVTPPDGSSLPGWPQTGGRPGNMYYLGLPVLADVNQDSLLEIFTGGSTLSGWHPDGSAISGWPWSSQASSPAVGDLNQDGRVELVVLSGSSIHVFDSAGQELAPFPKSYSGTSTQQYPVLGDVNADGRLEIVFNLGTRLYCTDDTGAVLAGFPRALAGSYSNSPILGDMDRDGRPEIVTTSGAFPSYAEIAAFHDDGTPVAGWPRRLSNRVFRAFNEPVLGDVNGDTCPEVVMGFESVNETFEEVHAFTHTGIEVGGWPKLLRYIYGYGITGSPVLADMDGDGEVEMAISSNAYWMVNTDVYAWDLHQPWIQGAMPWPTQRHDNQRTACLGSATSAVGQKSGTIPARLGTVTISACPNPTRGSVTLLLPGSTPQSRSIRICDATGREVSVLAVSGQSVVWSGKDAAGRPARPGVYFLSLPGEPARPPLKLLLLRD
jgi:hypothetical protein